MTRFLYWSVNVISYLLIFFFEEINAEEPWSFIVLADWHNAEPFATKRDNATAYEILFGQVDHAKKTYGGDLVILPGDSNVGHWYTDEFARKFRPDLDVKERVLEAGRNCYGSMRRMFKNAGYDQILMAVGDHEIGGNSWKLDSTKVDSLTQYREGFIEGFNKDPKTGEFLYTNKIGEAPSRPLRTPFQRTSYAYQHKNVLFITLDAFFNMEEKYIDRQRGLGGEGVITCTVAGKHLIWFEKVLIEARKDDTIKHIIVQAHLPIIQPVRKVSCSGQFMDHGEDSALWKTMVKYGVDIYFAGEVHTNTVTQDPGSNLLQIVSRGNSFNNFLKVEVTNTTLNITSYNEIGPKPRFNYNYEAYGSLLLNKRVRCGTLDGGSLTNSKANQDKESRNGGQKIRRLDDVLMTSPKGKKALVACGSGSSAVCGKRRSKLVSKKNKYPVRCCSRTRIKSPSTRKKKNCPYAATCLKRTTFKNLPFEGGVAEKKSCEKGLCSGKVVYAHAKKICEQVGGYICTLSDLAEDCARWTGCKYEDNLVWTIPDPITDVPSAIPSRRPNISPSSFPTSLPSDVPSELPSVSPSRIPSASPSDKPSRSPSTKPSLFPSNSPTALPSSLPSVTPSNLPSGMPSSTPSSVPSVDPTISLEPTVFEACTAISSSGVLELLDRANALIHLDFIESIPLRKRQIVGMKHDDKKDTLVGSRITIRGEISTESLPNKGSFAAPYDAQIANLNLQKTQDRSFGVMEKNSRIGIYGFGPHGGGRIISYAMWFNCISQLEMILIHYGHNYSTKSNKNIYTLTLNDGTPMLYISHDKILQPTKKYSLNDGKWHHIAVSMPTESCRLSDVILYVDGKSVETGVTTDEHIFFSTSGRLSIGGFGYSHKNYETKFPGLSPYVGKLDEFYLWGRRMKEKDLGLAMKS